MYFCFELGVFWKSIYNATLESLVCINGWWHGMIDFRENIEIYPYIRMRNKNDLYTFPKAWLVDKMENWSVQCSDGNAPCTGLSRRKKVQDFRGWQSWESLFYKNLSSCCFVLIDGNHWIWHIFRVLSQPTRMHWNPFVCGISSSKLLSIVDLTELPSDVCLWICILIALYYVFTDCRVYISSQRIRSSKNEVLRIFCMVRPILGRTPCWTVSRMDGW